MAHQTVDVDMLNSRFDLRDLAASHTALSKHSGHELAGPCPKCGGHDRFYVGPDYFACRSCHPKKGDAIGFISWVHGVDFLEAVKMLDSSALPPPKQPGATPKKETADGWTPAQTAQQSLALVRMQTALHFAQSAGSDYLGERRLTMATARRFGLGFAEDACGRGPALAMPWFRARILYGIRYRLIAPTNGQRVISEPGSRFGGYLFGGQAMPLEHDDPLLAQRYLFVVEGEINAMSVWQVGEGMRVDVLSLGSESATLPDSLPAYAKRYRACVVWMDKESFAKKNAAALSGYAFWSQSESAGKRDANDYLKAGNLTGLVGRLLQRSTPEAHAEALKWDLWDGGIE